MKNRSLLKDANPSLFAQLHKHKNTEEGIDIDTLTPASHTAVWWQCPEHESHIWFSEVANRRNGSSCPYCLNQKVLAGYNDLATVNKELASEWNFTRNVALSPTMVTGGSNKLVWWQCSVNPSHEWEGRISDRSRGQKKCPKCPRMASISRGSLSQEYPEIAKTWHPSRNGTLTPNDVSAKSRTIVWWICEENPLHEWQSRIGKKVTQVRCVICHGHRIIAGVNDLVTVNPELSQEWHTTRNADLLPSMVTPKSKTEVWWQCPDDSRHYWKDTVTHRTQGRGCSLCSGKTVIVGINDLTTVDPDAAALWHPTKNGNNLPTMFTEFSGKNVWWQCQNDKNHVYYRPISSKGLCQDCYSISTSRIQHDFEKELQREIFDTVGNVKLFISWKNNKSMRIDIHVPSRNLIVEYDGEYFHNGKCSQKPLQHHLDHDGAKTLALLSAGYSVVRVRENNLVHLDLEDKNLFQISHRNGSSIQATVREIIEWIDDK